MNKLNYAFAMLTAAGGSMALPTAAGATTLFGSFTNSAAGLSETFEIQSDGGVTDSSPAYTDFVLTNDSLGNTLATVGDNTTGFKAAIFDVDSDSYFGTGSSSSSVFSGQTYDSFKSPLYSATEAPGVLQAGTYTGDFEGSTLVLSATPLSAVPEPEAWALLIAGAAMVGGSLRGSRRRVLVSA